MGTIKEVLDSIQSDLQFLARSQFEGVSTHRPVEGSEVQVGGSSSILCRRTGGPEGLLLQEIVEGLKRPSPKFEPVRPDEVSVTQDNTGQNEVGFVRPPEGDCIQTPYAGRGLRQR